MKIVIRRARHVKKKKAQWKIVIRRARHVKKKKAQREDN